MRRLRVVISGGAVPAIVVAMIAPTVDACGGSEGFAADASADARDGSKDATLADVPIDFPDAPPLDVAPPVDSGPCTNGECAVLVSLPPAGTPADLGLICASSAGIVDSPGAARVTLTAKSSTSATGFISVPAAIDVALTADPVVSVANAPADITAMQVSGMGRVAGGWSFLATWPSPIKLSIGESVTISTELVMSCDDGGTRSVISATYLEYCIDGDAFAWVSSGDACTVCCQVVAEMAPSPIVSDNQGDDLPLARALRLRVVEVARAGKHVLLFAENDAGDAAEYEWRVSGGSLARVADDVMLWTLPEDDDAPFGQVAVWNDAGAAVENFAWARAGAAA